MPTNISSTVELFVGVSLDVYVLRMRIKHAFACTVAARTLSVLGASNDARVTCCSLRFATSLKCTDIHTHKGG